jgi:hypothetical protein
MSRRNQTLFAVLVLCVAFAFADRPAEASIPTGGQVAWIGVAIGAAGAAIGIGIYYAVRHNRSVTGCAVSGPNGTTANGMTLTSESDKQTYALTGDVAGIKPGDRVRVSGKKSKQKFAGVQQFLVEKVSRDFGACRGASESSNVSH